MLRNLLILIGLTLGSLALAAACSLFRSKGHPSFSSWWNSEGIVIFMMLWFGLGLLLVWLGVLPL